MMKFKARKKLSGLALLTVLTAAVFPLAVLSASASDTNVSYDFNTSGQLAAQFNSYTSYGSVTQSSSGGIGNSGAVQASSSADAVFASKDTYSIGPIGSTYEFTSFVESVYNAGYSGMGFTSHSTPTSSNTGSNGSPFRPNDALGISVHGGGFVFHVGSTDINGDWDTGGSGITTVQASSVLDLLNDGLNNGSNWYKVSLTISRVSSTSFDMTVKVWPVDTAGAVFNSSPSAVYTLANAASVDLISAPSISSYLNFSGSRVRNFDNYSVNLSGGATVVTSGQPVVLTTGATDSSNIVTMNGNLTGSGALQSGNSTVSARGFVYSTSSSTPTLADSTLTATGTATGTYSASTANALAAGTYNYRAYATNSAGTTYGAVQQFTLSGSVPTSYSVTFDGNGADGGSMSTQSSSAAAALTANGFTRTGYTFAGWSTTPTGISAYADSASYPFTSSTTLYALWTSTSSSPSSSSSAQQGSGSSPANPIAAVASVVQSVVAGALAMTGVAVNSVLSWSFAQFAIVAGLALVALQWIGSRRRTLLPILSGAVGTARARGVKIGQQVSDPRWNPWPGVVAVVANLSDSVAAGVDYLSGLDRQAVREIAADVRTRLANPKWNPLPGVVAVFENFRPRSK